MGHYALTSGGTGGHVFPAISLAEELKKNDHTVCILTDPRGRHFQDTATAYALPIYQKSGFLGKLQFIFGLLMSICMALFVLLKKRPLTLVSFGGYPSIPAVLAAWILRIPLVVHEQNAVLGRANRFSVSFARCVAKSFMHVRLLKGEAVLTGNPVRPEFIAAREIPYTRPANNPDKAIYLLILGGSQGAKIFSDLIPKALRLLPIDIQKRIVLYQQCRRELIEVTRNAYADTLMTVSIEPFFENVAQLMAQATLIVSRSGASSLAELTVVGRPVIFVPYPHAMDNHQWDNAQALSHAGATIFSQHDLTADQMAKSMEALLMAPDRLTTIAANIRRLGHPHATKSLYDCVVRSTREITSH